MLLVSFRVAAIMLMEMFLEAEVLWQLSLLAFEFEILNLLLE